MLVNEILSCTGTGSKVLEPGEEAGDGRESFSKRKAKGVDKDMEEEQNHRSPDLWCGS